MVWNGIGMIIGECKPFSRPFAIPNLPIVHRLWHDVNSDIHMHYNLHDVEINIFMHSNSFSIHSWPICATNCYNLRKQLTTHSRWSQILHHITMCPSVLHRCLVQACGTIHLQVEIIFFNKYFENKLSLLGCSLLKTIYN